MVTVVSLWFPLYRYTLRFKIIYLTKVPKFRVVSKSSSKTGVWLRLKKPKKLLKYIMGLYKELFSFTVHSVLSIVI